MAQTRCEQTDGQTNGQTDRVIQFTHKLCLQGVMALNMHLTLALNMHLAFDIETGNAYGQYQQHEFQWIELMKIYSCVKYERIIINSIPTFK